MMSSLYTGISGLKVHGEGMSVLSNNLANVNTVGFKKTMALYQDLTSQTVGFGMATGASQVGVGAQLGDIRTIFAQGGIETGSAATDMAISGLGFFGVHKEGEMHYTRAGNFRFTQGGDLVDPSGWNLVGYPIVAGVLGTKTEPVKLDIAGAHGTMPSKATTSMVSATQLGDIQDKSSGGANPFFSMVSAWDAQNGKSLAQTEYSYSHPVSYYDSNGISRSAALYFDKVGSLNGNTVVEYVLGIDPESDGSGLAGTQGAGLLMAGTMTFSSTGELCNMTAFQPPTSGNPADLAGWKPAGMANGNPVFTVHPAGAAAQQISLNMGIDMSGAAPFPFSSAADTGFAGSALYTKAAGAVTQATASYLGGASNGARFQSNDGYASGGMYTMRINEAGVVQGVYSNGQSQDLYKIPLYRFTSQDGLRNEGGNHYSATAESGAAAAGMPGTENFGLLSDWSLEASNVDHAEEFTTMIVTQRAFQMNSKVITTSDAMLQKALELKRT